VNELQSAKRVLAIRARVAATPPRRVSEMYASSRRRAREGSEAGDMVALADRSFHDQRGTEVAVGFAASDRSAQILDDALIGPFRGNRRLSGDDLVKLMGALESFRLPAPIETTSPKSGS
jgi:hypothetical protein